MKNSIALVTGASTGIGRAIAIELAKTGTTVFLVARKIEKLKETKELVEKNGGSAEVFTSDLSDVNSINELIKSVKAKTNKISILVNVAGIWHANNEVFAGRDLEDFDQKVILDTFAVGLIAPTLLVHGLLAELAVGGGKVINISGTFEDGAKGWLPYYASKRAIEDLTVGLSEELKRLAIDVNCISPSDVATEEYKKYFPEYAKDALTPEEVAKFVVQVINKEETGKVWVLKKGKEPKEGFHF